MSTVSTVSPVLQARQDATRSQIDIAVLGKQLKAQKQTGDAINQLVRQSVDLQKQLASGHVDVQA